MEATDRQTIKTLVRVREDFQRMRKAMDNRIGRKADGEAIDVSKVDRPMFKVGDYDVFQGLSDNARSQEKVAEKEMKKMLERFPIYTHFLRGVKGVGPISAAWIVGSYDISIASTVSKLWQYTGLNAELVRGKKRKEHNDGTYEIILTDDMIRGDKMTSGFVAPFNKELRTALLGVMADGFIKAQNSYALDFYYPYKHRLENSEREVLHLGKMVPWKDVSKGHRDRAAKRYMLKMFLKDLYVEWRTLEGLPVRASYQEEYLGHVHIA